MSWEFSIVSGYFAQNFQTHDFVDTDGTKVTVHFSSDSVDSTVEARDSENSLIRSSSSLQADIEY
jgi:hypothetical protein